MFRHPFSFKGRIRRLKYGLSWLLYLAVVIPLNLFAPSEHAPPDAGSAVFGLLALVTVPPVIWFMLAQGAKRCHDRDTTGMFQIVPFYTLWLLFAPGQPGPNRFGPAPGVPADTPAPGYLPAPDAELR